MNKKINLVLLCQSFYCSLFGQVLHLPMLQSTLSQRDYPFLLKEIFRIQLQFQIHPIFFFGLLYFVVPLLNSFQFILSLIFGLGYQINFILAGFNLIPFGPLDGKKVMEWNPIIWAVLFFPLLIWFFYL